MLRTVKQLLYFLNSGAHSSSDELPRKYSENIISSIDVCKRSFQTHSPSTI